jgi:heat shock protein HtpX
MAKYDFVPAAGAGATKNHGAKTTMNQLKTLFLLGTLSAVLIAFGGMLGPGYLYGFTALALVMNLVAYFFSDRIVLRMHKAQQVTPEQAPELYRMVQEVAQKAGVPMPRVYIIPEMQPNAFATGRNPENGVVAVTEGIMHMLNARELRGVIAHEMAHIKNRDILVASVAAAIAAAVTYIANAAQFAFMFGAGRSNDEEGGSPIGALLMAFVAPVAATLIQLGISRSREYLADETAAKLTGDPEALALALEKLERGAQRIPAHVEPATASLFIVSPLSGGRGMSWFSTHPPMAERIARLRGMDGGRLRAAPV